MKTMYTKLLAAMLLTACASLDTAPIELDPAPKASEPKLTHKETMWGTNYYAHEAKVVSSGYGLRDSAGKEISPKISQKDYCLCGIEGTCSINGQIYDYKGRGAKQLVPFECSYQGHKIYWSVGKFKYGKGNKGNALEPFVSVAADQSIYPFGTKIFIPQAVGVKLPGGKIHDGFFRVDDVGGAIKGNHLDFFIVSGAKFPFVSSSAAKTFTAYIQ